MQTAGTTNRNAAPALVLVGGLMAALSGVLGWHDFTGPGTDGTLKGTDLTSGLGTLLFGVILIVVGGVLLARARSGGGGRGGPITAIVMGVLILIVGGYSAVAPESAIVQFEASDLADDLDISEAEATVVLENEFESGQLEATALIGTWVAAGGGLLALLGGIMGIGAARKAREQQPAAAPPSAAEPRPTGAPPEA